MCCIVPNKHLALFYQIEIKGKINGVQSTFGINRVVKKVNDVKLNCRYFLLPIKSTKRKTLKNIEP